MWFPGVRVSVIIQLDFKNVGSIVPKKPQQTVILIEADYQNDIYQTS